MPLCNYFTFGVKKLSKPKITYTQKNRIIRDFEASNIKFESPFRTTQNVFTFFANSKRKYSTSANNDLKLLIENPVNERSSEVYKLSIPLSKEKVAFFFKPESSVRDFIANIHQEDPSIMEASLYDEEGSRIAVGSRLEDVIKTQFKLVIDNQRFNVSVLASKNSFRIPLSTEGNDEIDSQHLKIDSKIAALKKEFLPIFLEKRKLDRKAKNFTNLVIYGGLGVLCAQWCILARLTWWDFNWDIMEPVTYFITLSTAVLGYVYFVFTKRDYTFQDLKETIQNKNMLSQYTKSGFDIDKYFALEYKLKRVDPESITYIEHNAEEYKKYLEDQQKI
jgi:hypothetical protein